MSAGALIPIITALNRANNDYWDEQKEKKPQSKGGFGSSLEDKLESEINQEENYKTNLLENVNSQLESLKSETKEMQYLSNLPYLIGEEFKVFKKINSGNAILFFYYSDSPLNKQKGIYNYIYTNYSITKFHYKPILGGNKVEKAIRIDAWGESERWERGWSRDSSENENRIKIPLENDWQTKLSYNDPEFHLEILKKIIPYSKKMHPYNIEEEEITQGKIKFTQIPYSHLFCDKIAMKELVGYEDTFIKKLGKSVSKEDISKLLKSM